MPNSNTFSIKPISKLLDIHCSGIVCDPFAKNSKRGTMTNDLDTATTADSHKDALEWLKSIASGSVDVMLFDPPYSPRQVSECYKKMHMVVDMKSTQSSFWGDIKKEISRCVRVGGKCITFGWCSNGVGKSNGFEIEEILLVAHGGWHNDTIVTVERKMS